MCRTGGRRCPAYKDPEKIAERNARRRAAYAMNKGKKKKTAKPSDFKQDPVVENDDFLTNILNMEEELFGPNPSQTNEALKEEVKLKEKIAEESSVPKKNTVKKKTVKKSSLSQAANNSKKTKSSVNNAKTVIASLDDPRIFAPVFEDEEVDVTVKGKVMKNASGEKLFKVDQDSYSYDEALNIGSYDNSGYLADNNYFNKKTITGVLDYTKLDGKPETDEKLGFRKIKKDYDIHSDNPVNFELLQEFKNMGEIESKEFSEDNTVVVKEFSVATYEWLNDALYKKEVVKGVGSKHDTFQKTVESANYSFNERTFKNLSATVEQMDSALSKGPKKQRTLYRGVASYSGLFKQSGVQKSASDWVDDNLEVGKEIQFDAYQSSTPKPQAMSSFLSNKGLMYEIITPEGVNISAQSSFDKEYEVTLPRNAKYTVVSVNKNVNVQYGSAEYEVHQDVTVVRLIATNSKGEILDGTNSDEPQKMKSTEFKKVEKRKEW